MNIVWGITGAGHLLRESLEILDEITNKNNNVTIILSKAGLEVIQNYGYNKKLENIIKKDPKNSIITDEEQQYSYPFSGKLTHNKYDMIIISPTTANTTAKIVNGIADTLVTNVVAQSGKGQIPTIVVPVDQKEGTLNTILPIFIEGSLCQRCNPCPAKYVCPTDAIEPPTINTSKCIGCKKCKDACEHHAIVTDKIISILIRHIDAKNTRKLDTIENITTVLKPEDILDYLE